jgi:hypothetical protein
MTLQAVTANRLSDGQVVYLTARGSWSQWLSECRVADSAAEGEAMLAVGQKAVAGRVVIDPYLFAVAVDDGALRPLSQRETIRARGPSVRLDLGYQAAGS